MVGTAINPPPISRTDTVGGNAVTASSVNSFRISAVADRLAMHVCNTSKNDAVEFFNLCLSLARGIDYAVANGDVPSGAKDLPFLIKKVCMRKDDSLLRAAIMVVMLSVKNACKMGWFSNEDAKELVTLANEVGSTFCSARDINTDARIFFPTISTIMSRFYPRMKMGQILAFLEVKPGYGAFMIDFHILKNENAPPEDKIRLLVAQTDNIETSSCIISPPRVNFLLNGKGVERRTNVMTDTGPQIPTVVAHMLKFGTNLLQAVGQFNGNYIIVVAYMSVISNPDRPVLQDYVPPAVAALDSDSEVIEGPSRISLNCPISFGRIKTPAKGHSCKHLQCFDLDNYVEINSRRPSWRCPHCYQHVCFTDIRIDQNMVKVLKEVGENIADVIISTDGSWKAIIEGDDCKDKPQDKTSNCNQDEPVQGAPASFSSAALDILDLTDGDDEMDAVGIWETERKPFQANFQSQFSVNNPAFNMDADNTTEVNQNSATQIEDDFWSGIYLPTNGSGTSNNSVDAQVMGSVSGSIPSNFMLSPVLTDAISPALNQEPEAFHGTAVLATSSMSQSQISTLQLEQSQFRNSIISNEYGRFPSIPRHFNRTPVAVQALPAQTPTSVPQHRPRMNLSTYIQNGPSAVSQTSPPLPLIADGFNTVSSSVERQQQFSRSHLNPLQVSHMTSCSLQQQPGSQDHSFISSQPAQQTVRVPSSSQLPGACRVPLARPTERQNSHHQQPLNLRMPCTMSQPPSLVRSSTHFPRAQVHQGGAQIRVGQTTGTGTSQQARFMVAAQMARQSPPTPVPNQTSRPSSSYHVTADGFMAPVEEHRGNTIGAVQPLTRADGSVDLPAEQNWRPTGRMRGSLSGPAYSAALSQLVIQPTQPVQAARPLPIMTSPPPGVPPQLHVLVTHSRNAHASQGVNYPLAESANMAGGLSIPPARSSGMH